MNGAPSKPTGPVLAADPSYALSIDDLDAPSKRYCDDCKRLVLAWPWNSIRHQAPAAMEMEACPLCKFILEALELKKNTLPWRQSELSKLCSWADEGDAHQDVTIWRRPITDIASDQVMNGVKSWLRTCSSSHERCTRDRGNFMESPGLLPRRILDLNAKEGLVISRMSGDAETGVYATLSYPRSKVTTIAGLTSKMVRPGKHNGNKQVSIEVKSLPPAFQDAIEICRKIGIKMLWIDAFCFVQDDPQDRLQTLDSILPTLDNAAVCIRMANISNIHESCLRHERRIPAPRTCIIRVSEKSKLLKTLKFISEETDASESNRNFHGPLLENTALTAAESFVSRRHLTITPANEIAFACLVAPYDRSPYYCWCYTANNSYNQKLYPAIYGLAFNRCFPRKRDTRDDNAEDWCTLLRSIQVDNEFRPEDRLPIVESIAKDPIYEGEYMYGVMKSCIRLILTWTIRDNLDGTLNSSRMAGKPYSSRVALPSWSWASVTGEVYLYNERYLKNWLFHFVDWKRAASSHDGQAGAILVLKGKVIPKSQLPQSFPPVHHFIGPSDLDISRGEVGFPLEESFLLLLGQIINTSPPSNRDAAPSKTKESLSIEATSEAPSDYTAAEKKNVEQLKVVPSFEQPPNPPPGQQQQGVAPGPRQKRRLFLNSFSNMTQKVYSRRLSILSGRSKAVQAGLPSAPTETSTPNVSGAYATRLEEKEEGDGDGDGDGEEIEEKQIEAPIRGTAQKPDDTPLPRGEPAQTQIRSERPGTKTGDKPASGEPPPLRWRRSWEDKGDPYPKEFTEPGASQIDQDEDRANTVESTDSWTLGPAPTSSANTQGTASKKVADRTVHQEHIDKIQTSGGPSAKIKRNKKSPRLREGFDAKIMILRKVGDNTFQRVGLMHRAVNEECVEFWDTIRYSEIRII